MLHYLTTVVIATPAVSGHRDGQACPLGHSKSGLAQEL